MVFFSSGLWPAGFSLCIVAVMLVMFWQERFPSEVIALSGAALFLVMGILPYETALQVFSNPAPWTIGAMFIVVAALVRTGALDALISAVQNQKNSILAAFWPFYCYSCCYLRRWCRTRRWWW